MENAHEALQKFEDKSVRCLRVNWVEVDPVCAKSVPKCTYLLMPFYRFQALVDQGLEPRLHHSRPSM